MIGSAASPAMPTDPWSAICAYLNNTPRKCLGWQAPTEAFKAEIMNLR